MNGNLNGFRALTAGDLDSVSGGGDIRGAVVGYFVTKLIEQINFIDAVKEKGVGTLKGLSKPMPK